MLGGHPKSLAAERMTPVILTKIFVEIDDFMKEYEPQMKKHLIAEGSLKRNREGKLTPSEVMTLLVYFHISGYRNFKDYVEIGEDEFEIHLISHL